MAPTFLLLSFLLLLQLLTLTVSSTSTPSVPDSIHKTAPLTINPSPPIPDAALLDELDNLTENSKKLHRRRHRQRNRRHRHNPGQHHRKQNRRPRRRNHKLNSHKKKAAASSNNHKKAFFFSRGKKNNTNEPLVTGLQQQLSIQNPAQKANAVKGKGSASVSSEDATFEMKTVRTRSHRHKSHPKKKANCAPAKHKKPHSHPRPHPRPRAKKPHSHPRPHPRPRAKKPHSHPRPHPHPQPRAKKPHPQPKRQLRPRPRPRPAAKKPWVKPMVKPRRPTVQPRGKSCRYQRKQCGTKCQGGSTQKKCVVSVQVPKLCEKNIVQSGLCVGNKPKLCDYTENEPSICTKKAKKKVQCPPEEYKCQKVITERKRCPPDGCEKWRKKRCVKKTRNNRPALVPCKKPKKRCRDCRRDVYFAKCKHVQVTKVQVPCRTSPSVPPRPLQPPTTPSGPWQPPARNPPTAPPGPWVPPITKPPENSTPRGGRRNPSPTPSPSCFTSHPDSDPYAETSWKAMPKPNFKESGRSVSAIRCVGSGFASAQCKNVNPECRTGAASFKRERCIAQACSQCSQWASKGSAALRDWCRQFQSKHCFTSSWRTLSDSLIHGPDAQLDQQISRRWSTNRPYSPANTAPPNPPRMPRSLPEPRSPKKCFKQVSKTVLRRCNKKLPRGEGCWYGCRTKLCPAPPVYCKNFLPPHCPKKEKICDIKKKITTTCTRPGKNNCDSEVTSSYVCNKKKNVKRPCKKVPCKGAFQCALEKLSKKCSKTIKAKYVCGQTTQKKVTACSQSGGSGCKPVYCNVKVCN